MKILALANQKGGVGKSAIATQIGFYAAELKKRVIVIDLDHQQNTSKAIRISELANVSSTSASKLLKEKVTSIENAAFLLVHGDDELSKLEREKADHNAFATNFSNFLKSISTQFDICIIDTNPTPDIRMTSALVVATHVLSPIQLNQEALDGVGKLRNDVNKIKTAINKNINFIGLLPNLVVDTPFQKSNLLQLAQAFGNLMIKLPNGQIAAMPMRTAVAEAQALGKPIWRLGKSSAREAWTNAKPIFDTILNQMGF